MLGNENILTTLLLIPGIGALILLFASECEPFSRSRSCVGRNSGHVHLFTSFGEPI